MLKLYVKAVNAWNKFRKNRKGSDIVAWVGLIALAIGIIIIVSPTARASVSGFFNNVMDSLSKMGSGQ